MKSIKEIFNSIIKKIFKNGKNNKATKEKAKKNKCKYLNELINSCSLFYIFFISIILVAASVGLAELYIFNNYHISIAWWIIISLVIVLFVSLFLVFVFKVGKGSLLSPAPNKADGFLLIVLFTCFALSLIFAPYNKRYFNLSNSYFIAFSLFFLLDLFYLIHRAKKFDKANDEIKVYRLDCMKRTNLMPPNIESFYIEDELVCEDLLKRGLLIKQTADYIFRFSNKQNRVIGITGKWGSGKSALFKLAYESLKDEKNNYIVIDNFNCWNYEDERSLFIGIIETIYKKLEMGSLNRNTINQIEGFANTVLEDAPQKSDLIKFLIPPKNTEQIKTIIDNKLKYMDKHLVFVFENLDRVSFKNIIYVYKAISSSLKFSNMTYVCLYDEEIVEKALVANDYNYKYLDKILNYKVSIPSCNDNRLDEFVFKCVDKYLTHYFKDKFDFYRDDSKIKAALKYIDNPRDLCRFLNLLNLKLKDCDWLNITDLIILTVIKTINFELYNFIFENKNNFTVDNIEKVGYEVKSSSYHMFSKYFINDKDENSEKYEKYYSLITLLFPNLHKTTFREEYNGLDVSLRPIYYDKFFDSYFIDGDKEDEEDDSNPYKKFKSDVYYKDMIDNLDENGIKKIITNYPKCAYGDYIECYTNYLKYKNKIDLINNAFKNVDSNICIDMKDFRERYILFLNKMSKEYIDKQVEQIKLDDFKYLSFYLMCCQENSDKKEPLSKICDALIELLITSKFNIYDEKVYQNEIIGLLHSYDGNYFRKYMNEMIEIFTDEQVILFLKDISKFSSYTASAFIDRSKLNLRLRKIKAQNDDEKEIINKFIRNTSINF